MTLGMRIRLWGRQAPRVQVVTTSIVTLFLTAMLVVVAVPKERSVITASGRANAPSVGKVGSQQAAAGSEAQPDSAGSSAAGTSPAGVLSAGKVGTASGPASAAEGQTAASEPLRASEQGVTADTIKVGFLIDKTGGLDATGFALGIRQDQPATIKAIVDWANQNGGIKGREVTYVTANEDGTNSATWQPACVTMTEDEKVFAVMSGASHNGSGVLCYVQHHVPDLNSGSVTVSEETFGRSGGYVVSSGASGSRAVLNWADSMLNEGQIGPGKGKLGLLTDACPQDVESIDQSLKPFLQQSGVDFVEARVSCDISAAQQQVPAAVLQMRNAGVDRVFVGVLFSSAQTFMQQADAQQWRPKYLTSDFWGNNLDFTSQNFPPSQFDGAIATAFSHAGEDRAQVPLSEPVKLCDKILRDAGLPGITAQMGTDAEVISECDNFFLFMKIMEQIPVNPTHDDWPAAVSQVGTIKGAYGADASLGPGKYDGGDSYALLEWHRDCKCWVQSRPHQPAHF